MQSDPAHTKKETQDYALTRDLETQLIDQALVMPIGTAPSTEESYYRGGVYDQSGEFCAISGLTRVQNTVIVVGPYPKSVIDATFPAITISQPAVFCGYLDAAFGHFLLESASRLWWGLQNKYEGSYVFQIRKHQPIPQFCIDFFTLLGIQDQIVYVTEPTLFTQLVVPESAFNIRTAFHSNFLLPFRFIRKNMEQESRKIRNRRIYLSRTQLANRQVIGEETVERMFEDIGFEIVHPETLSLREQITLAIEAKEIAGTIGSALHILVFTENVDVIYIMPSRRKSLNYSMIDQAISAKKHDIFAPGKINRPKFKGFRNVLFFLDLETVQSELVLAGHSKAQNTKLPSKESLESLFWSTWNKKR